MPPYTLMIKELIRNPQYGPEDRIEFKPGVNLIIGPGNSGKTKWLNMLDFLMGDPGKPEDAFPLEMVEKYSSIKAIFIINNLEYVVERNWKEKGNKGKIFVDNERIDANEFQQWLLEHLKIPILHFPKGNPYDERAWPELSWRILYRHIYRQQRFWSDIADKQPDTEQLAALMQFLGIAENLYSGKSGELVRKRKELWKSQGGKDQFLTLLDQITKDVSDEKEIQNAVTSELVDMAINRISNDIQNLQNQREQILTKLQDSTNQDLNPSVNINSLSQDWADLNKSNIDHKDQLIRLENRMSELDIYLNSINQEISKIERARKAGLVLVDLKVTNCPVCDQIIDHKKDEEDQCYLCGKPWKTNQEDKFDRLEAEAYRLQEEKREVINLLDKLSTDRDKIRREIRTILETIQRIENQLSPIRKANSSIVSPEIGIIDMEKGRLHERIRQLERIKVALDYHKQLSQKIDELQEQISLLEAEEKIEASKIHYNHSADLLSEGMNTYLSSLEANGKKLWQHGRITTELKEKGVDFNVNGDKWSTKLGGTSILYFLLSYHYGMLNITNQNECHYPGILILDLPATFLDGSSIRDKENFIAEPFIRIVNKPEMKNTQVIITGQAFEELKNVNRITFSKIW